MSIKVVIADDQALVRGGFRMILDAREDIEVAGEAADGAEAIALVGEHDPGVVLMVIARSGTTFSPNRSNTSLPAGLTSRRRAFAAS
jgi:DNA-binding NarL/FixJ family response regulator